MRKAWIAAVAAAVAVLAGCTGVPTSSAPQVVQSVGNTPQYSAPLEDSPQPGDDPRSIVTGFLGTNASEDARHLAARRFLTAEANNQWSDTKVYVLDAVQVGNPDARHRVAATGQVVGTIDANGIYTSSQVVGSDGVPSTFNYTLRQVSGQWRIDKIQPGGLVISYQQFVDLYAQQAVYFFDQDEKRLVPDPRFTALRDPVALATWLMAQLAGGARPELQAATQSELPNLSDPPRRVTVDAGPPMRVEITGAGQLAPATRDRLAAQVALTLVPAVGMGGQLTISDGGRPVDIPAANGTVFSAAEFEKASEPVNTNPELYWLDDNGRVVEDSTGERLAGPLGNGDYHLDAVGLARLDDDSTTLAAGTVLEDGRHRLYAGTSDKLHATTISDQHLSRPAWAPDRDEVWVGAGTKLYRTSSSPRTPATVVPVTAAAGSKVSGNVLAVRFSPEGSRVALVIGTPDSAQLWLGSVVRSTQSVQVSNLQVISPSGVSIRDVGWNDQLKLFVIGQIGAAGSAHVYEVQCDGSEWSSRNTLALPGPPDSITVAVGQLAAVSAGDPTTVWVQSSSSWTSATSGPSTPGTNPIYLE